MKFNPREESGASKNEALKTIFRTHPRVDSGVLDLELPLFFFKETDQ